MYKREVALLVFYNDKNEILMQDRMGHSKSGEEWGFFGGAIEEDETPEQALVREIKEEMNLDLVNKFKQTGIIENTYFSEKQNCDVNVKRFVFVAKYENEKYKISEGRGAKWFDLNSVKILKLVPGDSEVVKLVQEYLERLTI